MNRHEQKLKNLTPEQRLVKIAEIVARAEDRNPMYLDAPEVLGIYLLATAKPDVVRETVPDTEGTR